MAHVDEGDAERADVDRAAQRHLDQLDLVQDAALAQLVPDQIGGEGGGVDRRLDARPQPAQGADMVFVRVGQNDALDRLAFQIGRIGHDHIHAGRGQVAEGDADIDDQPFTISLWPEAIGVEVHTDLVRAAQRQENEFVLVLLFHSVSHLGVTTPDFQEAANSQVGIEVIDAVGRAFRTGWRRRRCR